MRSFDPKDEWHVYEMAWTPNYIAWSVDNKEVRRIKSDEAAVKHMKRGQSIQMNFWTPTFESWADGFEETNMPWYTLYDFVEAYTWNAETNGFDFAWRDDFDTFDAHRWQKSDNTTFAANSTTFRGTQTYVQDGNLVLKMEPDAPWDVFGVHRYEPTLVVPEQTQPAPEHTGAKGKKGGKGDTHQDVAMH